MNRAVRAPLVTTLAATLAAALVAAAAPAAPAAHAGAADLPLAIAETELARVQAAADAARYNAESPGEVTCANPDVAGSVVVPAVHHPGTISVWGRDYATGKGHCVSLQRDAYETTLLVVVEWRDAATGRWHRINGCAGTSTVPAGDGLANPVVQPFPCAVDPSHAAAGSPRRVHGFLSTTLKSRVYEGFSPVYLSPDEDWATESGS